MGFARSKALALGATGIVLAACGARSGLRTYSEDADTPEHLAPPPEGDANRALPSPVVCKVHEPSGINVPVSGDGLEGASPAGLAFVNGRWVAAFTGIVRNSVDFYFAALDGEGQPIGQPTAIGPTEAAEYLNAVVWAGDRFGVVWEWSLEHDFRAQFALLREDGLKVAPGDVVLGGARDEAYGSDLAWTGSEFVATWAERTWITRGDAIGNPTLFARRVGLDGRLLGSAVKVAEPDADHNGPTVATDGDTIALAWTTHVETTGSEADGPRTVHAQIFDRSLSPVSDAVELSQGTSRPAFAGIVSHDGGFVAFWEDRWSQPLSSWAARMSPEGRVDVGPKLIGGSIAHVRHLALVSLGQDLLAVYARDSADGDDGYELFATRLGSDLTATILPLRLTNSPGDSTAPRLGVSSTGDVGVLFEDDRTGVRRTYFTWLDCVEPVAEAGTRVDATVPGDAGRPQFR